MSDNRPDFFEVKFTATYKVVIKVDYDDDIEDAIANIDIPEGIGPKKAVYQKDTLVVQSCDKVNSPSEEGTPFDEEGIDARIQEEADIWLLSDARWRESILGEDFP